MTALLRGWRVFALGAVMLWAFVVGAAVGLGVAWSWNEPWFRCMQAPVSLSIRGAAPANLLPAQTRFRMGKIADATEAWFSVELPPGMELQPCDPEPDYF